MSSSGKGYSYTGSGTNSQGNHYCSRDYGTGSDRTVLVVVMHTTTLTATDPTITPTPTAAPTTMMARVDRPILPLVERNKGAYSIFDSRGLD
ncbi:hypothetical protein AFCA_013347 [Aspergillus flavus]|nr:hypothetical protein AFCA_013347 [Aspergillus flavus]